MLCLAWSHVYAKAKVLFFFSIMWLQSNQGFLKKCMFNLDMANKSILFVYQLKPESPPEFLCRPSTDLLSVFHGCQKGGRKKRHRTSTHSQNLHFLGVTSALFWATVKVSSSPSEEPSPAEGESLYDSMFHAYVLPLSARYNTNVFRPA